MRARGPAAARAGGLLTAPTVGDTAFAETLAVACPFCTVMLDDGVKSTGRDLRVVDLATLLAEAVDDGQPASPSRSSS